MKRSTKAATLSLLVPGAGLWYLGEKRKAIVNFLVAFVLTMLAIVSAHEHVHYAFLAIAFGSSGYAHAIARSKCGSSDLPGALAHDMHHDSKA